MSQCPFGGDGEFSFERFTDSYNSALANNLGNLYSRILTMCLRYFEGNLGSTEGIDLTLWRRGLDLAVAGRQLARADRSRSSTASACGRIWMEVVDSANRYIQETEPFKLAKTDLDACRVVLVNLAEWLRVAAILIKPFLPRTAETFYRAFNFEEYMPWDEVSYGDAAAPLRGAGTASHGPFERREARAALPQGRSKVSSHLSGQPAARIGLRHTEETGDGRDNPRRGLAVTVGTFAIGHRAVGGRHP